MLSEIFQSIPNEHAVLELIQRFDKLIKKYAMLLKYEDAYNDMRLFFIELIISMSKNEVGKKEDAIIVKYIAASMKNHYIKLSKQTENEPIVFSDLSDEQLHYIEEELSYSPSNNIAEVLPYRNALTKWEYQILFLVFVENIPVSRIALLSNKSRQAVNQTKIKALNKIKNATE